MIGYGLSNGIQVQMSRRAGEGDQLGLTRTLTNGIMLSVLFALGMMLLSLWLAPLIFGYSLSSSENVFLSIDFLYIRVWGLPFLMLTQLMNAFYISTGRSRFLIYGSLVSTAVNIIFDYFLIFGHGGFEAMGFEGAALASVFAEISACLIMCAIFFIKRLHIQYRVSEFWTFDTKLSQKSLKVSAPLIVQFLFSIGGWQIFFIFVEHLGERELASSQILRSVFGIMSVGTWAFAATCNTMVSNLIGQRKQRLVLHLVGKVMKLSISYVVIIGGLLLLFGSAFLSLYRNDPDLVSFAIPSLHVILVAALIMSLSTTMFNAVLGTGNTLVNLFIEVTCVLTYLVYCYIVIERMRLSLAWAWGSEFVYWTSLLIISGLYLRSGRWKDKKI
jgi:putative MATE family efflux protein